MHCLYLMDDECKIICHVSLNRQCLPPIHATRVEAKNINLLLINQRVFMKIGLGGKWQREKEDDRPKTALTICSLISFRISLTQLNKKITLISIILLYQMVMVTASSVH